MGGKQQCTLDLGPLPSLWFPCLFIPRRKSQKLLQRNMHQCYYLAVIQVTLSTSDRTTSWLTSGPWANGVFGGWLDSVRGQDGVAVGLSAQSETWGRLKQSVPLHGVPDPLQVAAHFGIDTGLGSSVARDVTPGHNALQDASTDQGSPGVTL